jgi:hypothetical protein
MATYGDSRAGDLAVTVKRWTINNGYNSHEDDGDGDGDNDDDTRLTVALHEESKKCKKTHL